MTDKSLFCGDADCEGVNCKCRVRSERQQFHVSAGKYDSQERNCKYCESFNSIDDAIEAYDRYKSYPWAVIEYGDYEFTPYKKALEECDG